MRTIDADALKNKFANITYIRYTADMGQGGYDTFTEAEIEKIIDNAPTAEPTFKPIAYVIFDTEKLKELTDDIVERIKSGEIVLQNERPKGEWIEDTEPCCSDFDEPLPYICPFCNGRACCKGNFCPNCGAMMDMRGEEDL